MVAFPLSGFVDEISPDLGEQLAIAAKLGLTGIDVRSVNELNVLQLSDPKLQEVRDQAADLGLNVQAVGSPVNKVAFSAQARIAEKEKLKQAIHAAHQLDTKRIRVFSPEVPLSDHESAWPEVLDWMQDHVQLAQEADILLIHENDASYYGAYPANAFRLLQALHGPHFRFAFDFANTVKLGFRPIQDWLEAGILGYTDTIHIKDARLSDGEVVPAGEGDGQMPEFFAEVIRTGWQGTLTMEPHLAFAGHFHGFSGAQQFELATNTFRELLAKQGGTAG